MMKTLVDLSKEALLSLDPKEVTWLLSQEEVLHIFIVLGGYWTYEKGNPYHAELLSGSCSNGFFFSKTALQYPNLCQLFGDQLAMRYLASGLDLPSVVYGIPKGAKNLGDWVADALGVRRGTMAKTADGNLTFVDLPLEGESALFVEDFCTRATAFKIAESLLYLAQPKAYVIPFELVILNRGRLKTIETERATYGISALVNYRIDEFTPGATTCYMCEAGSKPIRPKITEDNWALINAFQPA